MQDDGNLGEGRGNRWMDNFLLFHPKHIFRFVCVLLDMLLGTGGGGEGGKISLMRLDVEEGAGQGIYL